jgi:hypothetical protein
MAASLSMVNPSKTQKSPVWMDGGFSTNNDEEWINCRSDSSGPTNNKYNLHEGGVSGTKVLWYKHWALQGFDDTYGCRSGHGWRKGEDIDQSWWLSMVGGAFVVVLLHLVLCCCGPKGLTQPNSDSTDGVRGTRCENGTPRSCANCRDRRNRSNSDQDGAEHAHRLWVFPCQEIEGVHGVEEPYRGFGDYMKGSGRVRGSEGKMNDVPSPLLCSSVMWDLETSDPDSERGLVATMVSDFAF